jgi:hypothetical protein
MKKLNELANDLIYGDMVHKLAAQQNIGLTEARSIISQMSFVEYRKLSEDNTTIVPPSGTPIGSTSQESQQKPAAGAAKATWTGKGPLSVGMTVGLKGPNGLPVPGEVSQVDMSAKGVKVKNPTTGQTEWMNVDALQPFMAAGEKTQNIQPGAQPTQEEMDLARLRELAGITENCSGGATGAGAIAVAPVSLGKVKRRQPAEEALKNEYTPKGPAKTVVGDTKPSQASGKLSADLAASGKVSASRVNNGRKR